MNFLLDPNVAYLLLAGGLTFAILALITPGTGLLELGALLAFLLAGYSVYNLPINLWALVILLIGVFPFMLAVRKSGKLAYLAISIVALVVGSAFLFRSDVWYVPAVNPLLALVVSVLMAGYFWVATRKILEVEMNPPVHDLEGLIGQVGEAKSAVYQTEGSVQVNGELWSAQSETPIPGGAAVRVVGREGFVLQVKPENSHASI
jgi:membrane-bound serine protease (ClpP class)